MVISSKKLFVEIKGLVIIALCMISYAISWNLFLFPHNITGGGGTGIATVVMYATQGVLPEGVQDFFASLGMASIGGGIPVSATIFVFNAILIAFAVRILGWQFCIRTIYGVCLSTASFWVDWRSLFARVFGVIPEFDPFMSVIIAGIIGGVTIGMVFTHNGSTGGTDILAKMINKYKPISLGKALLMCDFVVICASGLTPEGALDKVVYGLIFMTVQSFSIDLYINGLRQSVQFLIISRKADEIADAITNEAHRGVTLLDGIGWYSKDHVKVALVVVRKHESTQIFKIVNSIDRNAFISQSAATGVFGQGFEVIEQK